MWKSCSWAGSVAGDGLLVGGRVLRNGSARGLRVDGLEDASMDMSGVRRQSQEIRRGGRGEAELGGRCFDICPSCSGG
jgi:hypothetical protein